MVTCAPLRGANVSFGNESFKFNCRFILELERWEGPAAAAFGFAPKTKSAGRFDAVPDQTHVGPWLHSLACFLLKVYERVSMQA